MVRGFRLVRHAMRPCSPSEPLLPASLQRRGLAAAPTYTLVVETSGRPAARSRLEGRALASALLDLGFSPVAWPQEPLPRIPRLTGYRIDRRLSIHDTLCDALFSVVLADGGPWPRTVDAGCRIGLVFPAEKLDTRQALGGSILVAACQRLRTDAATQS